MPIDKYQPCPCGSGKKIKFCCSADLIGELEKIQRMLDGDQRRACLEHVVHLLEKHPGRPSLLSIKATLENQLGDSEHAEETIKALLERTPRSPVALAENARLLAREGKSVEAAEALQDALEVTQDSISMRIYEGLTEVAMALLEDGHLAAARAHLLVHASIGGEEDSRSASFLMEMNASGNLPLLVRQDTRFAQCDDGVAYKNAFDAAMQLVGQARWRAALVQLEQLAEKHGREAVIHRNIAILRGFLGRDEAAARSWRRYSGLIVDASLDDAVEAEALAQLLDSPHEADSIDVVDLTYELTDIDRTMELFLSHQRLLRLPVDLQSLAEEGMPPPKGVFSLLDRDMPESGEGLSLETVPRALCDLYIFGRETDRPARMEMTLPQTLLEQAQQTIADICGELVKTPPEQSDAGKVDKVEERLSWSWRWPKETSRETRNELTEQQRRLVILDVWPTVTQSIFDGKSPRQVQGDPKYQTRLLAAILLLELHAQQNRWKMDYNELRGQLGLPQAGTIDPQATDLDQLSLVRYARLDSTKLDAERLVDFFQYASLLHAPAAVRKLGLELIHREGDEHLQDLNKAGIYGILARSANDSDEAIAYIEQARQIAVANGQSQAQWLLAELPLRIEQRNGERMQQIIDSLQAKYSREPGVMQALVSLLARFGLIQPGAAPAGDRAPPLPAEQGPPEGIWTPDLPAAASAVGESAESSKSGLWLPGMD